MHLPTLISVTLLINLVIGSYLFVLYRRKPKDRCFFYWSLSCFSFVSGGVLASLRAFDYPVILTFFVAEILLIAAPILIFVGLIRFSRFRYTRSRRKQLIGFLIVIATLLLFAHQSPPLANFIASLCSAYLFWICARLLKKSVFNEPVFTRLLQSLFMLHGLIMLLQGLLSLLMLSSETTYSLPDTLVYILLSHITLTTLTALLLPWLSFLKLERKLTLKSQRDGLTSLANRSHFFNQVERRWRDHPNKSVILLMVDIDHFKAINDQYGHAMGDRVIRGVAKTLSRSLRSQDIIGRVGGEEYAIMLTNERLPVAENIANRLCRQVSESLSEVGQHQLDITISIGMVEALPARDQLQDAFNTADKALYTSKNQGRNTVTVGAASSSE